MKHLLVFFIFTYGTIVHAQNNTLTVLAKVVDENNKPVNNANVLNLTDKTGTISNNNGYFYLNVTDFPIEIEVSRIGFKISRLIITKDVYDRVDTFLLIKMEKTTYPLEEVEIVEKKPDIIAANINNWFILDFKISDEKAIVLFRKSGNRKIKVIDINTWLAREIPINLKGNELFKDCMGNIHLLTNDSVYQIQYTDTTINFYKAYSKQKFSNTLQKCVGRINNRFVFKSVSKHNQAIKYWYITNKKKQILYNIYDEERFRFAQGFLNRKNELIKKYGVYNELGDITVTQLQIIRKIQHLEYGYRFIGVVPAYNPLFVKNDTIFIFDNVDKSIVSFDSSFTMVKKIPISYLTKNSNKIYLDKVTGKFYIESNRLVKNEFNEVNTRTGKTSKIIKIDNCSFPEKVVFYGNKIFYIDDSNNNISLKIFTIN